MYNVGRDVSIHVYAYHDIICCTLKTNHDTAAYAQSVRAFAPQAEGWMFKSQQRQN